MVGLGGGVAQLVEAKVGGVAAEVMAELMADDGRIVGGCVEVPLAGQAQELTSRPEVDLSGLGHGLGLFENRVARRRQPVVAASPVVGGVHAHLDQEVGQGRPQPPERPQAALEVDGGVEHAEGAGLEPLLLRGERATTRTRVEAKAARPEQRSRPLLGHGHSLGRDGAVVDDLDVQVHVLEASRS